MVCPIPQGDRKKTGGQLSRPLLDAYGSPKTYPLNLCKLIGYASISGTLCGIDLLTTLTSSSNTAHKIPRFILGLYMITCHRIAAVTTQTVITVSGTYKQTLIRCSPLLYIARSNTFYRASQLCQRGFGSSNSVRLSVSLSVRLPHACFVTNPKNLPAIFLYHMKGQSFQFSATQQWLVGDVPFHLKWAMEVTHPPSKIAHVNRFPLVTCQQQ